MTLEETDLVERLHALAAAVEMAPAPLDDDVRRGRRRVRRNRAMVAGAAAASVALVLGVTAAVGRSDRAGSGPEPAERPGLVVGAVPVWYDAAGLHRGDVVEQTAVRVQSGTLALVRSGALYNGQDTRDVWFHPWGGEPRIVGHNSIVGPGGDPNGDTAVWFDGDELVVYDTATGRELSRTTQMIRATGCAADMCAEHYPPGNGFLQVSAERVVWMWSNSLSDVVHNFDVRTRSASEVRAPKDRLFVDVHDRVAILSGLVVSAPGRPEQRYRELESRAKVSPSGNYLLAVEDSETRHGAAILDLRTGELWRVPNDVYPWIAWSSGDIAMVRTEEDALLACDAVRRTCEPLDVSGEVLLPTN
jgi:hypothetical protein